MPAITEPGRERTPWRIRLGLSRAVLGGALGLALLSAPDGRAGDVRAWEVTAADVRVVCPMTIGGSFEARTRALSGTVTLVTPRPPSFSGELAVDLGTLETGIGLRDTHLREKYLEVGKGEGFQKALLSEIKLSDVDPDTFEGRTRFTGSFLLHGTRRLIAGEVEIRRAGPVVHLEASFPVNIPDFSIAEPRYLGVGVKDRVQVRVSLDARPLPPAGGGR